MNCFVDCHPVNNESSTCHCKGMTSSLAHYPENDITLFVHVHEYIKTYRIKMDPQCKQNYVLSMFTGKCLKSESVCSPVQILYSNNMHSTIHIMYMDIREIFKKNKGMKAIVINSLSN